MAYNQPSFDYTKLATSDPPSVVAFRKLAAGNLLAKVPKGLWNFGKLLVQGNELEGLETGVRMFTGYDAGLVPSLVGSFALDAARPWLKKGVKSIDSRLAERFGTAGTYGDVRNTLSAGHKQFKNVSRLAPAASLLGGVQQATVGFNQFDPAVSIAQGKADSLNHVANSLGYDDIGSLRADLDAFRPVIGAATGLVRGGDSVMNYLRGPSIRRRLAALEDSQLEQYTGQALNTYGRSFLDRSPHNQAAMIDSIYRQSVQGLK